MRELSNPTRSPPPKQQQKAPLKNHPNAKSGPTMNASQKPMKSNTTTDVHQLFANLELNRLQPHPPPGNSIEAGRRRSHTVANPKATKQKSDGGKEEINNVKMAGSMDSVTNRQNKNYFSAFFGRRRASQQPQSIHSSAALKQGEDQQPKVNSLLVLQALLKKPQQQKTVWKSPVLPDELYILDILLETTAEQQQQQQKSVHSSISSKNTTPFASQANSNQSSLDKIQPLPTPNPVRDMNFSKEQLQSIISLASTLPLEKSQDIVDLTSLVSIHEEPLLQVHRRSSGGLEPLAAPRLPKKPVQHLPALMELKSSNSKSLFKFNSCSTLFTVDTTVDKPLNRPDSLDITLKAVSFAIHHHLERTHRYHQALYEFDLKHPELKKKVAQRVFKSHNYLSEKIYPVWKIRTIPDEALTHPEIMQPPTMEEIFNFLKQVFLSADLTAEIGIIALIYLERMLERTKFSLFGLNCFRSLLGALMLASKVWDDQAVWNVDFKTIMPDLKLEDLNQLECWWLKQIQWDVSVKRAVFAKYWFEIRELAEHVWGVRLGQWTGKDYIQQIETSKENQVEKKEQNNRETIQKSSLLARVSSTNLRKSKSDADFKPLVPTASAL